MIPFPMLEDRAINAALDFANLKSIPSAEAVHSLFIPVAALSQVKHGGVFQVIPEGDVGAFVDDRAELIGWLDSFRGWSRLPTKTREHIHSQINLRLGKTIEGRAEWILSDGRLQTFVQPNLQGVQACYSFAAALLADEDEKRWKRLHKCALKECGRWFWESKVRAGPVRLFCCDQHATKERKLKHAKKRGRKAK